MPLIKYFGFVGSALVLLLIGLGWCLPQPLPEPPNGVTDRPAIRIASAEQLPERVIIDTSLQTIVPPRSALEFAEQWPQETVADVNPVPKPATPAPVSDVSTKHKIAKRERSKKVLFTVRSRRRISNMQETTKCRLHLQSLDRLCWTS